MSSDQKLNILVSYEYQNDKILDILVKHQDQLNIIIDSGAFSAFTKKKTISLDAYNKFIFNLKKRIKSFNFIQLDVVFNPEMTKLNLIKQQDAGLDPCPVYTRGEKPERFFELIEQGHYVFVGGVQRGENYKGFAKFLLEKSKGKKVHYLAFTKLNFIQKYSPYSVDSSTWCAGSRFGLLKMLTNKLNFTYYTKDDFLKIIPDNERHAFYNIGLNDNHINSLIKPSSWRGHSSDIVNTLNDTSDSKGLISIITMLGHIKQAFVLEKIYSTKTYFACGTVLQLQSLIDGYNYMIGKKILK